MRKRVLTAILLLCLLIQLSPAVPAAGTNILRPENASDLKQQISWFYQAARKGAGTNSFNGYCAWYVNWQLYLMGINREFVGGNGNDEFDNYRYLSKSNGGYTITAYAASRYSLQSALNKISENGTKNVYNILVGFQKSTSSAGQKYGHTLFIHAIIDGIVYYSDSMDTTSDGVKYPEGSPIAASIESFCTHYNSFTTLDGVVHFTRDTSDHTCTKAKTLFESKEHPHMTCYQCGTCGTVWLDSASKKIVDSCGKCSQPEAPVLKLEGEAPYLQGNAVKFTWNNAARATSYNMEVFEVLANGTKVSYANYLNVQSGLSLNLPAGVYSATLQAVNTKTPNTVPIIWAFAESNPVSLTVYESWPCEIYGHRFQVEEEIPAGCETDGWKRMVCGDCGFEKQITLTPTGHSFKQDSVTPPTANADGLLHEICTSCGSERITVIPRLSRNPFSDVAWNSYYYNPVIWAYENGIAGGTSATTFGPNMNATRAQVVTFLWRAAGQPQPGNTVLPFTDVKAGMYYTEAVRWAYETGITKGASATTFGTDKPVSRAEFVTFLYRAMGSPAVDGEAAFTDVPNGAYFEAPVAWAVANGVTNGVGGGQFGPGNLCSRAQVVTFIYRAYVN